MFFKRLLILFFIFFSINSTPLGPILTYGSKVFMGIYTFLRPTRVLKGLFKGSLFFGTGYFTKTYINEHNVDYKGKLTLENYFLSVVTPKKIDEFKSKFKDFAGKDSSELIQKTGEIYQFLETNFKKGMQIEINNTCDNCKKSGNAINQNISSNEKSND